MNDWQKRFSQKMELVRDVSRERFAQFAHTELGPVFEEFREFTFQQGIHPTTPIAKPDMQTFKFALTENTFLLLTFRLKGLEHCEMLAEYFVPKHEKIPPIKKVMELSDVDGEWVRGMFERALERYVDVCVEAFAGKNAAAQLAGV